MSSNHSCHMYRKNKEIIALNSTKIEKGPEFISTVLFLTNEQKDRVKPIKPHYPQTSPRADCLLPVHSLNPVVAHVLH